MTDEIEGDGAALYSTAHPLLITDEMVAAGLKASELEWRPGGTWTEAVKAIYTAMCNAAPPEPNLENWPSEDALVETTIEVERNDWIAISHQAPPVNEEVYVYGWEEAGQAAPRGPYKLYGRTVGVFHDGQCIDLLASGRNYDWPPVYVRNPTHWQPLPSSPPQGLAILNNGT